MDPPPAISEHSGTHGGAPVQFRPEMENASTDCFGPGPLIAPAVGYDCADRALMPGEPISRDMVDGYERAHGVAVGAVILFNQRGIRAIGCDTVACDMAVVHGQGPETPDPILHWLSNRFLMIEMLTDRDKLSPRCLSVATRPKLHEGSGSPIRPPAFREA